MSEIIIDRDDLTSIIGALVCIADSGMCALQERPNAKDAASIGKLCDLTARLLAHGGDPNAARYEHNAREYTRLVAAFELAAIAGTDLDATVKVG